MNLHQLKDNYKQVLDLIEEGGEGLEDTLESLEDAIEVKVENIGKVILSVKAEAEVIRKEEIRLAERRRSIENKIEQLKKFAEGALKTANIRKVKGQLLTVAIQKNTPSLDVKDERDVPKQFFIEQDPKLDRKKLLAYVKENGDTEFATVKQSESLRIR